MNNKNDEKYAFGLIFDYFLLMVQVRYESVGKKSVNKIIPPKEVSIHHDNAYIKSPLSDHDYGVVMNKESFSPENTKKEQKPSIGIYQIILDRKTQDIMTIRKFIKKEFFRKVSWILYY